MIAADKTRDEDNRIALLHALQLLDSPAEAEFDRITRLAARTMNVPIALVSLIDRERQWFKSRVGLDVAETARDLAFCAHALHHDAALIVPDATLDERFADNPLVTGDLNIRFYAGVPIRSAEGIALGTLCIIDREPRELDAAQLDTLCDLAAMVEREIMHREASLLSHTIFEVSNQSVADSEARFRATFEQAAVGMAHVDNSGRWIRVNSKLCDILGYTEAELMQLTFQDITHPDDLAEDMVILEAMLRGEIDNHSLEKRYIRKDGGTRWVNINASMQLDSAGRRLHFIAVIEDIQARHDAESALQALRDNLELRVEERTRQLLDANKLMAQAIEQQQRYEKLLQGREAQLRAVLENAQDAYIAIGADGLIERWNRQAELTFGWPRIDAIGRSMDELIVPEDCLEAHRTGLRHFLETGESDLINRRIEMPALHRNGTRFPVEVRISPLPSETGHRFCAFLHDISERKRAETALRESREQLRTIADNLPVFVAHFDAKLNFRFANEAFRTGFGLVPEVIVGRPLADVVSAEVMARLRPHMAVALAGERAEFTYDEIVDGEQRYWSAVYVPDRREAGIDGVYVMVQDVTISRKLELTLAREATQDVLTGLPNRRALLTQLSGALARCNRSGHPLGVLFLDLDGFKAVNDRYGHEAGDIVLKTVAQRLQNCVRETDLVARLAGDEFVVLLEALRHERDAHLLAQKIIAAIRAPIVVGADSITVGTSIGIYMVFPHGELAVDGILAAADNAMYRAKRGGRNRVFLASEPLRSISNAS